MKIILLLLALSASNAFAYGSIVFPLKNKATIEVAWLGNGIDDSEIEIAWDDKGQQNLFFGNICYKGTRTDAAKVLKYLNSNDFLGDEYKLRNIHFVGANKISYEVYDGPNRSVLEKNLITRCN